MNKKIHILQLEMQDLKKKNKKKLLALQIHYIRSSDSDITKSECLILFIIEIEHCFLAKKIPIMFFTDS